LVRLKELAEKVGVATEAFAAAKAGRSFCSLSGTTEVVPCYKAPLKRVFPQAVKVMPCYNAPFKRALQQAVKSYPDLRRTALEEIHGVRQWTNAQHCYRVWVY
jgi:hypothetical protein